MILQQQTSDAIRYLLNRTNESDDVASSRRAANLLSQERVLANELPEATVVRLTRDAARHTEVRGLLTAEQSSVQSVADTARLAAFRSALLPDATADRLAAERVRRHNALSSLTPEERLSQSLLDTARLADYRLSQTDEARAARVDADRDRHARNLLSESNALVASERTRIALLRLARESRVSPQVRADRRATAARNRRVLRSGPELFRLAAPEDLPSKLFLDSFETNPIAGMAVFWARTGNYLFQDFRDEDFNSMTSARADQLKAAMDQEAKVDDEVNVIFFYSFLLMDLNILHSHSHSH